MILCEERRMSGAQKLCGRGRMTEQNPELLALMAFHMRFTEPPGAHDMPARIARAESLFAGTEAMLSYGATSPFTDPRFDSIVLRSFETFYDAESFLRDAGRSEERRVGKECRSRW